MTGFLNLPFTCSFLKGPYIKILFEEIDVLMPFPSTCNDKGFFLAIHTSAQF